MRNLDRKRVPTKRFGIVVMRVDKDKRRAITKEYSGNI